MCKKEKGNKSGQLETIQCLKFIHMNLKSLQVKNRYPH